MGRAASAARYAAILRQAIHQAAPGRQSIARRRHEFAMSPLVFQPQLLADLMREATSTSLASTTAPPHYFAPLVEDARDFARKARRIYFSRKGATGNGAKAAPRSRACAVAAFQSPAKFSRGYNSHFDGFL